MNSLFDELDARFDKYNYIFIPYNRLEFNIYYICLKL